MLKVVLAALNSQYVHSSLAPWCLRAGIMAYGQGEYEVQVVEGTVNEPLAEVAARVVAASPDVLGLCCYIWNIEAVKDLLPVVRTALPECVIVLGGPEVSFCAEETLKSIPEANYLIAGEGELPLARLLDALEGQGAPHEVPGLCCRKETGFHADSAYVHEMLPPSPYCPEYFDQLSGRIAYIEASRGCPFTCAFCLSGRREGRPRFVPLERVYDEIAALAHSGAKTIKFVDRTFNVNRNRADAILNHIADKAASFPPGITFHFEIAGDILATSTLEIIAAAPAGLFQFEIGLQSMSEATLSRVRRNTDMTKLKRNVRELIQCGRAHVHLDLIAGLTGEDLPTFIRGFDEAYQLGPHALQLGFLKLIPGSAMREEPNSYPCAYDPAPPYTVISTPWMSAEDLDTLKTAEKALDKLHNSGRFYRTLKYLTRRLGLSPFGVFLRLGQAIARAEEKQPRPLSLDQLTACTLDTLQAFLPEHAATLRDLMLLDRLASVPSSVLPPCLKARDPRFFETKRLLAARYPRTPGVTRAMGFLTAGGMSRVAFCDYADKNPVTGRNPVRIINLSVIKCRLTTHKIYVSLKIYEGITKSSKAHNRKNDMIR